MVPGTQVGAYRVLQQIGEGGMGTVWLAEHTMLGRRAAIKLLHPMFSTRQDIVTRFFNEARAATAIADPGIVQIFDFGQHVDGTAYIAMEMLEGEPLDKRLTRLGRLGLGDAMRIMRQIASTLGVAHARGIVHRDLKPENIYLVRDPEVAGGERAKVLDFGIAKLGGDLQAKTNTSAVMGTPAYMSPEQCRGAGRVDQRSDVYALGCMLHALCTGGPPFDADGAGEIIAMHLRERPLPPSSRAPGIPPELDALVLRCLAKDPAQRFASGTELAAALGGLIGSTSSPGASSPGTQPPYPPRVNAQAVTTLSSSTGASMTLPRSSSRRIAAVAAGVVIVGGLIAFAATRGSPSVVGGAGSSAGSSPAGSAMGSAPVAQPPPPPRTPPDPNVELTARMKTVLTRFVAWSKAHAGEPCPTVEALGAPVEDAWHHPLAITCGDQPSNQIIGVISPGPDGAAGTPDDIGSWQLGRDVTDIVHGTRWPPPVARPPVVTPPEPTRPATTTRPPPPPKRPARPKPDDDDIPAER